MSNLQPYPAATARWWVVLLLGGLVLLVCAAPGSVLMGSLLLVSQTGLQSQACRGTGTPLAPVRGTAATSTPARDCGIDPKGNAIVAWALAIAAHLYPCPDIYVPGQLPPYMDVCYDERMPTAVIRYWKATCPGCRAWQNGNLQKSVAGIHKVC